jgi:hypothetical protein
LPFLTLEAFPATFLIQLPLGPPSSMSLLTVLYISPLLSHALLLTILDPICLITVSFRTSFESFYFFDSLGFIQHYYYDGRYS